MTDAQRRLVDDVMDEFPFEDVSRYMAAVGWRWLGLTPPAVPDARDLRREARRLLREALVRDLSHVATGGLYVRWSGVELELLFAPWEASAEADTGALADDDERGA